jgi:hypothetical protein
MICLSIMLSTSYRLKLIRICNQINQQENVPLSDMIWMNKLVEHNRSAYDIKQQTINN